MSRLMRVLATAAATMFGGCSDAIGPPQGLGFAAATPSCGPADGPADGPAIELFLAPEPIVALNPSTPYVRLHIDRSLTDLAGQSFGLVDSDAGSAWFQTAANSFELATSGGVLIKEVGEDNTITGVVDLIFPEAGRVNGNFRAEWVPRTVFRA